MAFGQATATSHTTSTILKNLESTWTNASARSCSTRRNRSARSVGAAVAASCKLRSSSRHSCKVSPLRSGCLSDASTAVSDASEDCISSSGSSTLSLPGSVEENQETQQQASTSKKDSSKKRHDGTRYHFGRISSELCRRAWFKPLIISKAFVAADKDQDGLLSSSDVEDVFSHFQLPSSDANAFFKALDPDDLGRIWWREVIAILKPMLKEPEPSVLWDDFYATSA